MKTKRAIAVLIATAAAATTLVCAPPASAKSCKPTTVTSASGDQYVVCARRP